MSLVLHAALALAVWGPSWWRSARTARAPAVDVDMTSETAPAKPVVETIGASGMPGLGGLSPSVLEVVVVPWPQKPAPKKAPPAPQPQVGIKPKLERNPEITPADKPDQARASTAAQPAAPTPTSQAPTTDTAAAVGVGPSAGAGVAPAVVEGIGNASFATGANLLAYAPPRHIVAVYVRLSALRGTPWEPLAEAVLRPLPDYGTLLGAGAEGSKGATVASMFDAIFISSYSPRRVDATLLAARMRVTREVVRAALAHAGSVDWTTVRGGVKGIRRPGDGRVFFSPVLDLMMLARASDLGDLLAPVAMTAPPQPTASAAASFDTAISDGNMPPWLAQHLQLETQLIAHSPPDAVPVIMMTGTVKPSSIWSDVLQAPDVALPLQVTASMVMERTGFVIRGNFVFADAAAASAFQAAVVARQAAAISDTVAALVLSRIGAKMAVINLSLKQTDRVLAFSTSISSLDGQKLLGLAAIQLTSYFAAQP